MSYLASHTEHPDSVPINMSDDSSNRTDVSTIHLDNISLQNRENVDTNSKFIGFDLSTQQLKAIVIDDKLKVCHQVSVDFDTELSEYKTRGGVHKSDDGSNSVTAPVNMWLKALDMTFDKLKIEGLDFSTVLGVSGCAQQHGSVWWRRESGLKLAQLNPDEYLHKELMAAFSLRDTPIWMDSSTSEECRELEAYVGGPAKLAELTGSRAYERFTGPQIARVIKHRREAYLVTERITLVSNFLASVLIGAYAPLDASDASGMNMMDVRTKRWAPACLEAISGAATETDGLVVDPAKVAGLRARLGCYDPQALQTPIATRSNPDNIVDTHQVVGRVARYFVERYGFPPECLVSSFTGDNPASIAGLCVKRDELVLSLGTSDTAFFWLDQPKPGVNGHVLRNPLDESRYMGLVCFKNGSRTRVRIRDLYCSPTPTPEDGGKRPDEWAHFERLLESVPRGNLGNLGFYFDLHEIFPLVQGDFRYNKQDERVESFGSPASEVRACIESQFLRLYHHSQALGLKMSEVSRVLVTGGGSQNRAICQVIADIFKSPVYTLDSLSNSACLGGAYLAKYAYELEQQMLDQSFNLGSVSLAAAGGAGVGLEQSPEAEAQQQQVEQDKQIDFSQMILGSSSSTTGAEDEEAREIHLVRVAEPTPIGGANQVDAYECLLERYVRLESELALNNPAS